MENVSPEMSFLEMLDALNKKLVEEDKDPVAFDHDCREGICGSCGMYINGHPHGPVPAITTCHLSMRNFQRRRYDMGRTMEGKTIPGNKGPDC